MSDEVAGWLMVLGFGAVMAILVVQCTADDQRREAACQAQHHGQPYTLYRAFGKDENGCEVKEANLYNGSCDGVKTVYVTNCQGKVHWTESHREGKVTRYEDHETETVYTK